MSLSFLRILPLLSLGVLLVVMIASMLARREYEKRRRLDREAANARRCPCGYLLAALTVPRCPECGRLVGFDKTAADLGISEAEMRAHAQSRPP